MVFFSDGGFVFGLWKYEAAAAALKNHRLIVIDEKLEISFPFTFSLNTGKLPREP